MLYVLRVCKYEREWKNKLKRTWRNLSSFAFVVLFLVAAMSCEGACEILKLIINVPCLICIVK